MTRPSEEYPGTLDPAEFNIESPEVYFPLDGTYHVPGENDIFTGPSTVVSKFASDAGSRQRRTLIRRRRLSRTLAPGKCGEFECH